MKPWMLHLIVRDSKIPALVSWFFTVAAIAFGPFIFIRKGYDTETLINHERIHIVQQYELLFVGQWLLYVIFWLIGLIKHRNARTAYVENPFEKEAYACAYNKNYLSTRKPWSWTMYV